MLSSTRCRICRHQGRGEVRPPREDPGEGPSISGKPPGQPAPCSGPVTRSHFHSPVLGPALWAFRPSIFPTLSWRHYYHHPHFTDGEVEAQSSSVMRPRSPGGSLFTLDHALTCQVALPRGMPGLDRRLSSPGRRSLSYSIAPSSQAVGSPPGTPAPRGKAGRSGAERAEGWMVPDVLGHTNPSLLGVRNLLEGPHTTGPFLESQAEQEAPEHSFHHPPSE